MKKTFIIFLTVLFAGLTRYPVCTHVHDKDCGPDAANCIHECIDVELNDKRGEDPNL